MNLVNSQEPETPAVPGGTAGAPARTRTSTRRSKLVEETQMNELLPTGDEAEIQEVREVREVVKRVAVVRAKKGGKKKGAGAGMQVEEVHTSDEEGAVEEEEEEQEEQEEEAPAAAPRRSGRGVSTRRQDTSARLGKELDEVMAAADTTPKSTVGRGGRGAVEAAPETIVRSYKVIENEGEEEAEEGDDVGIAAEEPAGAQHGGGAAGRRRRGRRGILSEEQLPATEEILYPPASETQAEEPNIPMEWVQATQEATAGEGEEAEEEEEDLEVPDEEKREIEAANLAVSPGEGMFHTPDEIPGNFPPQEEEEEEEQPTPSTKRGKRGARPETEPITPAKMLRGITETLRSVLPGRVKGAEVARREEQEEEEEEEEEEAAPVPAPVSARARVASKRVPAKKEPAPSTAKKGRKKPSAAPAGGRRRQPRKNESYKRYIFKVLKQVHPDFGISAKAMSVMHTFVSDQFDSIVEEAARLAMKDKKKTLTAREIQTAVRLVLPGELGKHAIAEGKKAVGRIAGVSM
ncbi:putative Histone H2B.11 [Nannochloris sp. 'desiccata']|nr:hypothetical protein KSW81_007903 [Chlorella desiccata (nom. nud.)]KAH7619157.1 putative Histone H2B.11 [Chlorella desiccata (nom. nud.)]